MIKIWLINNTILKKIYIFYRHECCFPYSISFFLVLLIYAVDLYTSNKTLLLPSIFSYLIITGYYIQNIIYYKKNVIISDDPKFFILILTVKILLWGILLLGLFIFKYYF